MKVAVAVAIVVALWLVYRALTRHELDEVLAALASLSSGNILAALAFAAASYLCLTGFDYLGLRYAGKPLAYRRAALASFTSLSIGHNVGVAALSSGAIRYRFYSRWGLTLREVALVILFSGTSVGLGLATLAGMGLVLYPQDAESLLGLDRAAVTGIALSCLAVPVLYLAGTLLLKGRSLRFRGRDWLLPSPPLALAQIALATTNFAFVAACLHQLLSSVDHIAFFKAAAVYAIANMTALISHVPGGLGVLEATVVYLLPGAGSLAALIAFRVIYFFIPLAFGVPSLIASEIVLGSATAPKPAQKVGTESSQPSSDLL